MLKGLYGHLALSALGAFFMHMELILGRGSIGGIYSRA